MHKYNVISIAIPVASVLIIIVAFFFLKPSTTGLVIYSPEDNVKLVNADVMLKTKTNEIIPVNALVEVSIDGKKASMTINEFIKKTNQKYEIKNVDDAAKGFYGPGFTGDHTYNLTLGDFSIDRNIGIGEHVFLTRIIYRQQILYEKENRIMISE